MNATAKTSSNSPFSNGCLLFNKSKLEEVFAFQYAMMIKRPEVDQLIRWH
jgi:hypothetical protein